jgi:hypothetical protein
MILAAHQPHYLPWLGYLDKMAKADVFVVMDDLQYEEQNFQNRNRVKLNHGAGWLTVPLESASQTDRICDRRIYNGGSPREHWQHRHWRTLQIHYGRTPHWGEYAPDLEKVYTSRWERLVDLDMHMLLLARRWLGITTPVLLSSSLGLRGQRTERILDVCRKVGATEYLSGRGGSCSYLDLDLLQRGGVTAVWQSFQHPTYPQRYPLLGFVPRLGFLDVVLNCGPKSRELLFPQRVTGQQTNLATAGGLAI